VRSEVPALFIVGTLDGRTPPGNAAAVARGFAHSVQIVVEGAGHGNDLLLSSPGIRDAITAFLRDGTVKPARIELRPFRFDPISDPQRNSNSSM
jgi:hypothetical protein